MNPTLDNLQSELTRAEQLEDKALNSVLARLSAKPRVSVINSSTVVTDADVEKAAAALQVQGSRDFAAAWGPDAMLDFVPTGGVIPANHWQLVILDNSPQADALGFHDLTSDGLPIGKVFAKSDLDAGTSWTVTASHELCEMMADPGINLTAFSENQPGGGRLYALESADACESDSLGYMIDGVLVSDFVYPSWFQPFWSPNQVQFDYGKHITHPFQILPGGYIGYYDVQSGNGWQQLTADLKPNRSARGPIGSRRERRRIPRSQWVKSTR